jgi:hypothetical protein
MTKRTTDDEVCCDMACPCGCGCRFHGGFPWDICECEWCTARREREQVLEEEEDKEDESTSDAE